MTKEKYEITLMGCDDWTEFDIELTSDELAFLERISKLSKEHSNYACKPIMSIKISGEKD